MRLLNIDYLAKGVIINVTLFTKFNLLMFLLIGIRVSEFIFKMTTINSNKLHCAVKVLKFVKCSSLLVFLLQRGD